MAPSPENDNAPKAPDKNDKSKCEKQTVSEICKEKDKDTKVSILIPIYDVYPRK